MENDNQKPKKTEREILIEKKTEEVLSLLSGLSYDEATDVCNASKEGIWEMAKNIPLHYKNA